MKILKDLEQNSEEWFETRKGKITGSKLKDIVPLRGTAKKIGFYQLLADRLAIEEEGENEDPRERGHRLEPTAIELFSKETGKKVEDIGMCISDENPNIALSPDGLIKNGKKYTEAVEVKCLSSAIHLQVLIEQKLPNEFIAQKLQYFIVNDDLQTLYFVFHDPRITVRPLHYIEVKREDVEKDIEFYKQYQLDTLKEIDELLEDFAF